MRLRRERIIGLLVLLIPVYGLAQDTDGDHSPADDLAAQIRADFRYHYSARPLTDVAVGFGITAVLANSNADQEIQRFFREDLQGQAGDELADLFTDVGDLAQPVFSIPIYLGAMWLCGYNRDAESEAARWGANSLRAVLVGTPELVTLAYVSGGQRPEEGGPGWNPLDDYNGVSGHAFYGAVPIIAAANLTDRRWLRTMLYAGSTLPGLARVYDDKHYFSQVFMGWWLAYASARTVQHTNSGQASVVHFQPLLIPHGGGLQVTIRF